MRKVLQRSMSLLVCAFLAAALFIPSASAQDTDAVAAEECFETALTLATEVVLVTVDLPGVPGDDYNNIIGTNPSSTTFGEERDVLLQSEVAVECDEVLGVQIPLAVTGSNVNLPVMIGFSLIGAGGLAVFAAKKRQEHSS
jgi:LPXTG-motif cell wall-anchored protein